VHTRVKRPGAFLTGRAECGSCNTEKITPGLSRRLAQSNGSIHGSIILGALNMPSKRLNGRLFLFSIALFVALAGLALMAGVPPSRYPPRFRIAQGVILLCILVSLLYQVVAQLPPVRFRIRTLIILVPVVAIQLGLARLLNQIFTPDEGGRVRMYILELIFVPGMVRGITKSLEGLGRYRAAVRVRKEGD
jgi:hypothetical protein